jgi:carboxyl-terminal processing protease
MLARLRGYLLVPLFVALFSIGAGVFSGDRVSAANDDESSQGLKSFTKVYDLVEQNFADPVKADKAIYNGAIPGMLRTLDPHSHFLDPKEYAANREDQRGHYFGIGMMVKQHGTKVVVTAPFAGSPAYKAGLHTGDVIIEVNDKRTDNLGVGEVADLLRGPRGTKAQVTVSREGSDKPLTFNVTRDAIARSSVSDAYWLKPGIAYIEVKTFNDENTSKEMEDKLKQLGEKDIKGLVLDLRENPGGLLTEGIEVAGHFLKKNQLVVSHRGRTQPTKNFTSHGDNGGKDYPLVVLVNRRSASAAEIVSGALQDHDRAWILGETTFGKGLVQTVYPLSDNTAVALTTMHFYTPSGRLIQRDYSNISFLDYYYNTTNRDQKNLADVKMTDSGRTVYGGGGISPDEKYTSPKLTKLEIDILRKDALFDFSAKYFGARADNKLPKGWAPDETLVSDFKQFMLKNGIQFTEGEFIADHDWVKGQLKHEMYIAAFGFDESERIRVEIDPEVLKAVDSMPKASALLEGAKKLLVQRLNQQDRAR